MLTVSVFVMLSTKHIADGAVLRPAHLHRWYCRPSHDGVVGLHSASGHVVRMAALVPHGRPDRHAGDDEVVLMLREQRTGAVHIHPDADRLGAWADDLRLFQLDSQTSDADGHALGDLMAASLLHHL